MDSLLVQECLGQVLNGSGRLSVISEAFHQPLADYTETQPSATLERELEEKLLGRPGREAITSGATSTGTSDPAISADAAAHRTSG